MTAELLARREGRVAELRALGYAHDECYAIANADLGVQPCRPGPDCAGTLHSIYCPKGTRS